MTEPNEPSTPPNSHRAPDELAIENELICTKLLGFTKHCAAPSCPDWRTADGKRYWNNPTFDNWADAGLILDALAAAGQRPDVSSYTPGDWVCLINATDQDPIPKVGTTGPLAIRAAALAYIKEHREAEVEHWESLHG